MNLNDNSLNKNIYDISSFHLNKKESGKKIIQYDNNSHIWKYNINHKPKMLLNKNNNIIMNTNSNKSYHKYFKNIGESDIINGTIGKIKLNNKIEDLFSIKSNILSSNKNLSNKNVK